MSTRTPICISPRDTLPYPMKSKHERPAPLSLPGDNQPNLGRHKRRCTVCHHPDRELIEQEFLRWSSPCEISDQFDLRDASSIYRHAHAFGLFARRRLNVRCVAEQILEGADSVKPTGNSVLRALRAFTQITDDGQWVEPPKRVVVTHVVRTISADAIHHPIARHHRKKRANPPQLPAAQQLLIATPLEKPQSANSLKTNGGAHV
jgi:hypothetical protein